MSTDLQIVNPSEVTPEQMDLVRRTVAAGATDDELKLFVYDCKRQGVHPLDKLLHFTKRGGKYVPITSIDLMRSRAAETGELAGIDDAVFSGEGQERQAAVTVYRLTQGQRFGYTATARWSEYYPGDQQGHMWKKMPHVMLAKVAEACALRKGFPRQLAGLYERAEMDQGQEERPRSPRKGEMVRSEAEVQESLAEGQGEARSTVLTPEPYQRDQLAEEIEAFKRRIATAESLGVMTTKGDATARKRWIEMSLGRKVKKMADITPEEYRGLNAKLLELMQANGNELGASAVGVGPTREGEPLGKGGPAPGSESVGVSSVEGTDSRVGAPGVLQTGTSASSDAGRDSHSSEAEGPFGGSYNEPLEALRRDAEAGTDGQPGPEVSGDDAGPTPLEGALEASVEQAEWRRKWFFWADQAIRAKVPGYGSELKGTGKMESAARASRLSIQTGRVIVDFSKASARDYENGVVVMRDAVTEAIGGVPAK